MQKEMNGVQLNLVPNFHPTNSPTYIRSDVDADDLKDEPMSKAKQKSTHTSLTVTSLRNSSLAKPKVTTSTKHAQNPSTLQQFSNHHQQMASFDSKTQMLHS